MVTDPLRPRGVLHQENYTSDCGWSPTSVLSASLTLDLLWLPSWANPADAPKEAIRSASGEMVSRESPSSSTLGIQQNRGCGRQRRPRNSELVTHSQHMPGWRDQT